MKNKVKRKIILLDGATGTELQKRGMPAGVCPEVWCLENPAIIEEVHKAYKNAGADVVYTSTFGANRLKFSQYGVSDVAEVNRLLAVSARRAVGKKSLVAGDIGPTGHFVEPFGDLDFEDAVAIFKEQARGLLEGGVDLFVIETMMDIQEARAALIAVKELTDKFTMVTMTYEQNGRTLNGTDPITALITLQSLGADAVGCNCSTGPREMMRLIDAMKPYATVPLVAKPNAGMPQLVEETTVFNMGPDEFASYSKQFASKGVNIIGGCCGTTPEHVRALKNEILNERPLAPVRKSISAVSSSRKALIFDKNKPLWVIGERINPTGKKALQRELLEGKMSLVRQMAIAQEKKGADLLDVNVGVPGIDEEKAMKQVIMLLAVSSELPLVVDSSNIDTIETALRLYPGRALINSISGEEEKIKKLLPAAARYGAMFILLPLTESEVPETAEKRKEIIKKVFDKARSYGFTREDIVIDGLVMAVSSNPEASLETLKTVEWSTHVFKCNTVVGLSNVSFGMPERKWLNTTFLAMAIGRGLTMAIANPEVEDLISTKIASDVLINRDKDAAIYLGHFSGRPQDDKKVTNEFPALSSEDKVHHAVLEGVRDDITVILESAIESGKSTGELIHEVMIPAITQVGELFDKREYFLPQLIASAETMKKGIAYLEPYLREEKGEHKQKPMILFATVKGDIHDIGKNIVVLMLKNHGYDVIDLGKDVPAETIIEEAVKFKPAIIGLSALMTTTMIEMEKVIDLAQKEGLMCRFMVGGAVVTRSYAKSIGAHYAKDGVEAVRVASELI